MDTYDGCCGSCLNLNPNDYSGSKDRCKCTERGFYVNLHERKCYAWKYAPNRDYRELNRRWYIVTAILDILGLQDGYESIALLHNFRINYLENDPRYSKLLAGYDIDGPKIASLLRNDPEAQQLCRELIQNVLVHVLDNIKAGNNEEAMDLYYRCYF